MSIISLVWGILSILGMIIAFTPCLGSLNWLNIPFAAIGLIIALLSAMNNPVEEEKKNASVGLVLCGIAVMVGSIRLLLGGGIL